MYLVEANLASNRYDEVLSLIDGMKMTTRCYIYRMKALIAQGRHDPAIQTGLKALESLGCPIPPDDAAAQVFAQKMATNLTGLDIETLHSHPPLADDILIQVQEVLTVIILPIYMSRPAMLPALCYLSLDITVGRGPSIQGAYPVMMLAAYLCSLGGLENMRESYAYGKFALRVLESSSKLEEIAPGMYHVFAGHIAVFHSPMQEVCIHEDLAVSTGKALFNVEYTVFSLVEKPLFLAWSGEHLSKTLKEIKACTAYVQMTKSAASNCFLAVHLQGIAHLNGEESDARTICPFLNDEDPSESMRSLSLTHAFMAELWVLILSFLHRDDATFRRAAHRCCYEYMNGVLGTYYAAMAQYITGLGLLRLRYLQVELTDAENMSISKAMSTMSDYAKLSPGTFSAKYKLLENLYYSDKDHLHTLDNYDDTIAEAKQYGCAFEHGIALEFASRWLKSIRNKRSKDYMQRAYNAYHAWGAVSKQKLLESEFPWLIAPPIRPTFPRTATDNSMQSTMSKKRSYAQFERSDVLSSRSNDDGLSELDLKTVLNASIQISQGLKAEEVFQSLMKTVILAAGADYGVLALYTTSDQQLTIHTLAENDRIRLLRNTLASESPSLVPLSIINTVAASQKPIIRDESLHNSFDSSFANDRYFLGRSQLKSVLCMPIAAGAENRCRGVLYLENNATSSAFTAQRLECLTLLCTQSAMTLERAAMYQELRAAKAQAEEATAQKSTFLANMSHEIRTPFNALLSCAIFLLDTGLTQVQKDYVTTIRDSATLTLSIIDGILDFSKVEQGMMDMVLSPFSLSENIETAMLVVAEKASKAGVDLVFSRKHEHDQIIGDNHHLRQVILNLLGNAVKFTSEGFVKVTTTAKSDGKRQIILITVQDTGIGISQRGIERLFKAFSQVDASINRSYGGTGLGLAISKKLIELMQGRIWLESTEGQGSTFFVELPVEIDSKATVSMEIAESKAIRDQGRLALVISRFESTADVLVDDLTDIGLITDKNTEVLNPDRIAEAAKRKPYSIIFVDLQVDGALDLVQSLQRILPSAESHFKIVILTHYGLNVPNSLSTERISGYLVKPIRKAKLRAIVSDALDSIDKPKTNLFGRCAAKTDERCSFKQLHILLAEDNIINTKVAIQHLKRLGHTDVTHAKDGIEVLEHVKAAVDAKQQFDIILMDLQMPRLDGVGATQELIRLYPLRHQRPLIIALTANATSTDKERCISAGMSGHIAKPILPEELSRTLNAIQRRVSASPVSSIGESLYFDSI